MTSTAIVSILLATSAVLGCLLMFGALGRRPSANPISGPETESPNPATDENR